MTALSRRRFLIVAASALATPSGAAPLVWTGAGLGGALSIRLDDVTPAQAARLHGRIASEVARIEDLFSLHRDSALVRLNRDGRLAYPAPAFLDLCSLSARVHALTAGRFDPTVQALWLALAGGGDVAAARRLVGWSRVEVGPAEIRLPRGMALTFNGIAQGFAADRIATLLRAEGLDHVLIDMGETVALGRRADGTPWRAMVQGPQGAQLGLVPLAGRALATSSPLGTVLPDGSGHILCPEGCAPLWSTVAVSAPGAALADALSTAFCLMDGAEIRSVAARLDGVTCEVLSAL